MQAIAPKGDNMKKYILLGVIGLLAVFAISCGKEEIVLPEVKAINEVNDHFTAMVFESNALAKSEIGESTKKAAFIYLPPSYPTSDKRYPVIYYIHGYGERQGLVTSNKTLYNQMKQKRVKEVIVVEVNASSKAGGSFMAASEAIGNWEDYLLKEVIPLVDENFRTIKKPEARGLTGFSMGGTATINLGLKYSDNFGALFSISPGLFDENGLQDAYNQWDQSIKRSYGLAYSPVIKETEVTYNTPSFDGSAEDLEIQKDLERGFGNLSNKVESYLENKSKDLSIRVDYGVNDYYSWIPRGCEYLREVFDEKQVGYEMNKYNRGHEFGLHLFLQEVLPYFEENLKFQ